MSRIQSKTKWGKQHTIPIISLNVSLPKLTRICLSLIPMYGRDGMFSFKLLLRPTLSTQRRMASPPRSDIRRRRTVSWTSQRSMPPRDHLLRCLFPNALPEDILRKIALQPAHNRLQAFGLRLLAASGGIDVSAVTRRDSGR